MKVLKEIGKAIVGFAVMISILVMAATIAYVTGFDVTETHVGAFVVYLVLALSFIVSMQAMKSELVTVILTEASFYLALCVVTFSMSKLIAALFLLAILPFAIRHVRRKDYDEVVYKLECILCHATGGKMSKSTYDLNAMETVVTDYLNETYDDGYKGGEADSTQEIFGEIDKLLTFIVREDGEEKIALNHDGYRKLKERLLGEEQG